MAQVGLTRIFDPFSLNLYYLQQMATATTLSRHRISHCKGESTFGDSSGLLFSMYTKAGNRTIRWSSAGKKMQMESSFS